MPGPAISSKAEPIGEFGDNPTSRKRYRKYMISGVAQSPEIIGPQPPFAAKFQTNPHDIDWDEGNETVLARATYTCRVRLRNDEHDETTKVYAQRLPATIKKIPVVKGWAAEVTVAVPCDGELLEPMTIDYEIFVQAPIRSP